jgi:hypothetical protein
MMMSQKMLHVTASVLILLGLVLLVVGLPNRSPWWEVGLGALALAMLFAFATHWIQDQTEAPEEVAGPESEE